MALLCTLSLGPRAGGAVMDRCSPDTRGVLVLSDLPSGFAVTRAARATPLDTSDGSLAERGNAARNQIAACEVDFARPTGIPLISSAASVWRDRAWAHLQLRFLIADNSALRVPLHGRVGDEAVLFAMRVRLFGVSVKACIITWRSGRVLKSVFVGGLARQGTPSFCVMLAERQQLHRTPAG
jgi:hypothetical protein